jgi:tetratricopeptide (TPR) repeat protein
LLRGFLYFKQGEYDKAIPDLDKVIALTPNSAKAYAGRGMCYSNKNRFKAAIADLTRALQLDPGFPQDLKGGIHGHLGRSLLAERHLQQAKHHLLIACKMGKQSFCKALQSPQLKNLK